MEFSKEKKQELIEIVSEGWNWMGLSIKDIKDVNKFGNIIVQTNHGKYYRICPEELSCELIANSENEYKKVKESQDFRTDWEMENLIGIAENKIGKLEEGQKFYLIMPAVIGGKYSEENIAKISFSQLILLSGDLAFQIRNLKEGQKVRLRIKN